MNWSPEQRAFMMWSVTPKVKRVPGSQKELAELLGVHETTLSRWTALPGWLEAKNNMVMRRLLGKLPDIINVLISDLLNPEYWQARRDFVRYAMPYLAGIQETTGYQEINASEVGALPASTIEEDLASFSGSERVRFLGLLEKIGAIQAGSLAAESGASVLYDAKSIPDFERSDHDISLPNVNVIDAPVSGVRPGRKLAGQKKPTIRRK